MQQLVAFIKKKMLEKWRGVRGRPGHRAIAVGSKKVDASRFLRAKVGPVRLPSKLARAQLRQNCWHGRKCPANLHKDKPKLRISRHRVFAFHNIVRSGESGISYPGGRCPSVAPVRLGLAVHVGLGGFCQQLMMQLPDTTAATSSCDGLQRWGWDFHKVHAKKKVHEVCICSDPAVRVLLLHVYGSAQPTT